MQVRCVTFGWSNLGRVFKGVQAARALEGLSSPETAHVENVLRQCGWHVDVLIDARSEPETHPHEHLGFHPNLLESMLGQRGFPDALQKVRVALNSAIANSRTTAAAAGPWQRQPPPELLIGVMCKDGIQNSVAFAALLQHVLGGRTNVTVERAVHLCEWFWQHVRCGRCQGCSWTSESLHSRVEACLSTARDTWRAMEASVEVEVVE